MGSIYRILSKNDEIKINNLIGSLSNSLAFVRNNNIYLLKAIVEVLIANEQLESINNDFDILSNAAELFTAENMDEFSLPIQNFINSKNEPNFDMNYDFSDSASIVNVIKQSLLDVNYNKDLLDTNVMGLIAQTLESINSNNEKMTSEQNKACQKIEKLLENEELANLYSERYNNAKNSLDSNLKNPTKESKKIVDYIVSVLLNKEYNEESTRKTYYINVGDCETLEEKIEKQLQKINGMYANLIDTDYLVAQSLYIMILTQLVSNEETITDKVSYVSEAILNLNVTPKVNDIINTFVTEDVDNEYKYADEDKITLINILSNAEFAENAANTSNNQLLAKIETEEEKLDNLVRRYKDETEEDYEYQIDDENPIIPSTSYIDPANVIYTKKTVNVNQIILNNNENIECENDSTLEIPIQLLPVNHKLSNIANTTLNIIESDSITEYTGEYSINDNMTSLTITLSKDEIHNELSLSLSIELDDEEHTIVTSNTMLVTFVAEPEKKYFYFGVDTNILDEAHQAKMHKIASDESVNDIFGKYVIDQNGVDHTICLVMPVEYVSNISLKNTLNVENDLSTFNQTEVTLGGIQHIIFVSPDPTFTNALIITGKNEDIEIYKNIEREFDNTESAPLYFYVGTTKPTSLDYCDNIMEYPEEQLYTNNSGAKSHIFVLTNGDKNVTFIEPSEDSPITQVAVDTTTISGYKIFETAVGVANTKQVKIRIS